MAAGLLAVVVRRWWTFVAAAALTAGVVTGAVAQAAVPDYEPGRTYVLTVRLTEAPRISHGQWGQSWYATATVMRGGPAATVTVWGSQGAPTASGDLITARMRTSAPDRPGHAASMSVTGTPTIDAADGLAAAVRARMRSVAGSADSGWLLSGMTLGMDQGLSPTAAAQMRSAGLTHLTAVSGANVAVLLALVWWLGGWLHLSRLGRLLMGCGVLAGFVLVVGPEPSVLRASVMAALAMAALAVGGRTVSAHLLQVAVVILLLIDPWLAYSVGFMLSIAATAGLVAALSRGPLAATIAAQIATLPILLALGAPVSVQSVVANLLVSPLAAAIPVIGLLSLVVVPLALVGRVLCEAVLYVASWKMFGPLPWVPGWGGVVLAAAVALVVLSIGRRRLVVCGVALIGVVSVTVNLSDGWPPRQWWLVACDVGQGDALVVRDARATVVVDTGPDPNLIAGCLDRLGIRDISLLVLTHFHADHVGGLDGVLAGRRVAQVWASPCREPADTFASAAPLLEGLEVATPSPGTVAQVGDMRLSVIWPARIIEAGSVPNNASVGFYLSGPHGTVALFGDVEEEAQAAILGSGVPLQADVAKVPHHGSAGFDPDLPAAVSPRIALIGVGENTFGHPTSEAVSAWQAVGAQVYTTQDNGDIALTDSGVDVRGSR